MTLTPTSYGSLIEAVAGPVLTTAEEIDTATSIWNSRFRRTPDVVVQCHGPDDVAAALRWRARTGVPVAVRGGGHSYGGHTLADGGLLLDLRPMSGIKVYADSRRVQVQAGATWADLDAATQHHGLATTGPTVSSVGVAGSVIGGATGWLSRSCGHGVDNVLSVDLVTADGESLRASATEHPDLFWGMRGAGHNLGVVTSLELRLHPVGPEVLAGQVIYPFDDAERLLRVFREVIAQAPDGFQCLPFTFRVPPIDAFPEAVHGRPVLDFVVVALDGESEASVDRLRGLADPILEAVGPTPYTAVQTSFDPNLPAGQRYYSTAHDLPGLTDAAIADFARFVRTSQGAFTAAYLEPKGGAAGRVAPEATAMGGRDAWGEFHVIAGWSDPEDDEAVLGWAHDFGAAMARHATGGVYLNLIGDDEDARVATAVSDVDRVRALKAAWDPLNVLRANHNLTPEG